VIPALREQRTVVAVEEILAGKAGERVTLLHRPTICARKCKKNVSELRWKFGQDGHLAG